MVLSITLGRIVDDVAGNRIGDQRWAAVAFIVFDRTMVTPGE
jgi:hypothetical protein